MGGKLFALNYSQPVNGMLVPVDTILLPLAQGTV